MKPSLVLSSILIEEVLAHLLLAGVHLIEYVAIKLDKFHNRKANTSSFSFQIIP